MTERELEPYKSVHNLAKPPKLAAPLEPGLEPEALLLPTWHQQKRRFRIAQHLLAQLEADHIEMLRRARDAAKQSFPSPGAGGGGRGGDTSDPTGNIAIRPHINDPAELAILCTDQAMRQMRRSLDLARDAIRKLGDADRHRIKALAMTHGEGILAELTEEEETDDACKNCAKAGVYSPRGTPPSIPQGSELCRWCHEFEREHGQLAPRTLVRKHDRGERIYTRDIERVLHGVQAQKPRG